MLKSKNYQHPYHRDRKEADRSLELGRARVPLCSHQVPSPRGGAGQGGHTSGTRAVVLSAPHLSLSLQMLPKAPGAQQAWAHLPSPGGRAAWPSPTTCMASLLLEQDFHSAALGASPMPAPGGTEPVPSLRLSSPGLGRVTKHEAQPEAGREEGPSCYCCFLTTFSSPGPHGWIEAGCPT